MTRDDILSFLRAHRQEMQERFGVVKIGLFGSYARGSAREDSDIDLAVELEGDRLFRKFFGLEQFLRENLHREIDLGVESALKPIIRKQVEQEILYV